MRAAVRSPLPDAPVRVYAVAISNALPLLGVLALGWNASALVIVYCVELAALCFWAVVRATFAGRPSTFDADPLVCGALEKRPVAIPVPGTGVGVQVSSLPVVVLAVPLLVAGWALSSFVVFGFGVRASIPPNAVGSMLLAAFVVCIGQGVSTIYDYFYRRGYRDHSAQSAIHGAFSHCLVVFLVALAAGLLGLVVSPIATGGDPTAEADHAVFGVAMLAAIALVKLGFELAAVYDDRLAALGESYGYPFGLAYEPPTAERVDATLSEPTRILRPTVRARLFGVLAHARRHNGIGAWLLGTLLALPVPILALGRVWTVAIALAGAAIALPLALYQLDYWVRYAGLEYRTDGAAIVAYDRVFRTPIWRVEAREECTVSIERGHTDSILDTTTIRLSLPDRDLVLPGLADAEPVLAVFDVSSAERAWG